MNPRRSRNKFSAFYIESDPETEQSRGSEYLRAKEQTEDHPQPEALYKSDSESEDLDPLASSTIIEGVKPLEPRPQHITDPFQISITAILEGQWEPELIDIKIYPDPELNFEPRTEMEQWNNPLSKMKQKALN